jgi:hypothetical protein
MLCRREKSDLLTGFDHSFCGHPACGLVTVLAKSTQLFLFIPIFGKCLSTALMLLLFSVIVQTSGCMKEQCS